MAKSSSEGGGEDGIAMIFSPSHLLCTNKSHMGANGDPMV